MNRPTLNPAELLAAISESDPQGAHPESGVNESAASESGDETGHRMNVRTVRVEFDEVPVEIDRNFFTVNEGIDTIYALSEADALDACVLDILDHATERGLSGHMAWLCKFAMQASYALRRAAGVVA